MDSRTKLAICAVVVSVAGILIYLTRTPSAEERASDRSSGASGSTIASITPPIASAPASSSTEAEASTIDGDDGGTRLLLRAGWGSGKGELGRERPQEGNPEGPMSFAIADGDLFVLDQVNSRLARYDRDGKLIRTFDAPSTAQDVVVAKDGTIAMVDRLVGKSVTLTDANGRKVGELSLSSKIDEPGLVTALVIDGKNVYAEKEHGALVLLGSTDGTPAEEGTQLIGRPSKDGTLLLTAGFSSAREGRAYLNAVDRKTDALRFARAIQFPHPSRSIVLLDTDAKGTIYLGVVAGSPGDAHVACLDPGDGHVIGRVVLPVSHTPEESFRDITVANDGTIVFALRTEDSVEYRAARCP
ncbi:MAG: hypothetical protein KF819_21070 [Labilithrix sp.]|nr:hypothetical protein [Labilithrix sp.]